MHELATVPGLRPEVRASSTRPVLILVLARVLFLLHPQRCRALIFPSGGSMSALGLEGEEVAWLGVVGAELARLVRLLISSADDDQTRAVALWAVVTTLLSLSNNTSLCRVALPLMMCPRFAVDFNRHFCTVERGNRAGEVLVKVSFGLAGLSLFSLLSQPGFPPGLASDIRASLQQVRAAVGLRSSCCLRALETVS